jgi:hypothetical protein
MSKYGSVSVGFLRIFGAKTAKLKRRARAIEDKRSDGAFRHGSTGLRYAAGGTWRG